MGDGGCAVAGAQHGAGQRPVGVGIAAAGYDGNQGVLQVKRRGGGPQAGLQAEQSMPNETLVLPQPVGICRDVIAGGDGVQDVSGDAVAVGYGRQIGAAVSGGGVQQGGQIRRSAVEQHCDDGVADDARPLAGGRIMGYGAGNGRVTDQQRRLIAAGNAHGGAAHHAAVGGNAALAFINDARRLRERQPGFQLVNGFVGGAAHTAPVIPRPPDDAAGKI